MTDKPILMTGTSVRGLLADRKRQTRRVVKPQPEPLETVDLDKHRIVTHPDKLVVGRCPYGKAGETNLWVRETWRVSAWPGDDCDMPFAFEYKDGKHLTVGDWPEEAHDSGWSDRINDQCAQDCDKAGVPTVGDLYDMDEHDLPTRWRPSIHMPRWASRIVRPLVRVRVERVQDISAVDAMWEGIEEAHRPLNRATIEALDKSSSTGQACINDFHKLWDSINAKPKPVLRNSRHARLLFGNDILERITGNVVGYVSYPWGGDAGTLVHRSKPWVVVPNPVVWALTLGPGGENDE